MAAAPALPEPTLNSHRLMRSLAIAMVALYAPHAQAEPDGHAACHEAGTAAEQAHGLPPGLLLAIGRVESGRRDPATGRVSAWPWTLNAGGTGQVFATAALAQAATRSWQAGGMASIDVGCFQVNLMHHPTAFTSVEHAFDPAANAGYAGRFLAALRLRTGSWDGAVAAYHSATPERGAAYRDRVMAGWPGGGVLSPAPAPLPLDRVVAWSSAAPTGIRIWTPSPAGSAAGLVQMTIGRPSLVVAGR